MTDCDARLADCDADADDVADADREPLADADRDADAVTDSPIVGDTDAVASRDAVPLLDAWKKQFPKLPLTCIGRIKAGEGITIRDQHSVRPLKAHGYDHFA